MDDPSAYYVGETRMGVVWPVDQAEGRLTGEETYSGTDLFAGIAGRKISLSDILPIEA